MAYVPDYELEIIGGVSVPTMELEKTIQGVSRGGRLNCWDQADDLRMVRHQMYHNSSSEISREGSKVRPVRNKFSG